MADDPVPPEESAAESEETQPERESGDSESDEAETSSSADERASDESDSDVEAEQETDVEAEQETDVEAEQETDVGASPPDVDVPEPDIPEDVKKYEKFQKIDGSTYDRANEFLRDRTYITAREWAIARLCADFRTETGVEMTKVGQNLPHLVPFMTDTYSPQAVNQARSSFEEKVRKAGATFLYGAMCDFFTAEELDDVMYEATEVAKFLLEVEGVDLSVEEELEAEDRISEVMRGVREHSVALRHDEVSCPECGHHFDAGDADE